ncbi:CDP-diacylglycerol diphosphatase [Sphaerimonospora cavernae]|uniref:CDP-diacylglycerol diphosphatase n=1 Tax=Sphaerimonospora cavernae TaxID=1740611 RepID=A0ABV6TWX7_9ACTN
MFENDEMSRLTRRRFVRFSGLAGVGAVLAGARSATAHPLPPVCGPDPAQCGSPTSTDALWVASQRCHMNNTCLQNANDYVVMPGNNNASHYTNYILVPTLRINGIECPWICESVAPNYWSAAEFFAGRKPTVVPTPVGLGINSVHARMFNQLHIHMATARPVSLKDLTANESDAARTVAGWVDSRVSIRGFSEKLGIIPHTYRVLIWPGINHDNLFEMLRTMLRISLGPGATTADAQALMRLQTLIVIPRPAGDYYIVNSENGLRDPKNPRLTGSNTCDPLLLLHP